MTALLPAGVVDEASFEAAKPQAALWRPAIETIADRHGLSGPVTPLPEGSCVLFAVGDHVIKLFEPWWLELHANESAVLQWLSEVSLGVPTPALVATDRLETWGYLVMSRFPGQTLAAAWPQLRPQDRVSLLAELGALARQLHHLPPPTLPNPLDNDWPAFLAQQRTNLATHHGSRGVPDAPWDLLTAPLDGLAEPPPVFLHTELTHTNVLVAQDPTGRWRLSGLLDFEPSRLGHPLYDLPAIALFAARGDRASWFAALESYGLSPSKALSDQLLAMTLVHRYSHLPKFAALAGHPDLVQTPPETWAETLFPTRP